jgi:hypothetical protein
MVPSPAVSKRFAEATLPFPSDPTCSSPYPNTDPPLSVSLQQHWQRLRDVPATHPAVA